MCIRFQIESVIPFRSGINTVLKELPWNNAGHSRNYGTEKGSGNYLFAIDIFRRPLRTWIICGISPVHLEFSIMTWRLPCKQRQKSKLYKVGSFFIGIPVGNVSNRKPGVAKIFCGGKQFKGG
jgi:hypothetical protein